MIALLLLLLVLGLWPILLDGILEAMMLVSWALKAILYVIACIGFAWLLGWLAWTFRQVS